MTFKSFLLDELASTASATTASDSSIARSLAWMTVFSVSFSFLRDSTSRRYCEMRSCSRTTSDDLRGNEAQNASERGGSPRMNHRVPIQCPPVVVRSPLEPEERRVQPAKRAARVRERERESRGERRTWDEANDPPVGFRAGLCEGRLERPFVILERLTLVLQLVAPRLVPQNAVFQLLYVNDLRFVGAFGRLSSRTLELYLLDRRRELLFFALELIAEILQDIRGGHAFRGFLCREQRRGCHPTTHTTARGHPSRSHPSRSHPAQPKSQGPRRRHASPILAKTDPDPRWCSPYPDTQTPSERRAGGLGGRPRSTNNQPTFNHCLRCVLPIELITLKTVFNRDLVSASYVIKSAVGASVVSSKISIARARADPMV